MYTKVLIVLFLCIGTLNTHAQGTIDVSFVKLESDNGQVIINLFDQSEGFPSESDRAYRSEQVTVKEGKAHYIFQDVPWGEYAVAVMHDENGNGEVEKNFLGIPKEKVGVSNVSSGIPTFKRAAFNLNNDHPRSEFIIEPFN
ncbi:MAG: DUF2141 domain-containing protein [Bacteroidota bacterium]